jgi:hypothetical protein
VGLDVSPFELTPSVPAAAWDVVPIVLATFRRRDLTT